VVVDEYYVLHPYVPSVHQCQGACLSTPLCG
jgi:hypothetical protein